ncbi:HAD family phosphatase [Candidatus Micrarchaeota archaeon]|nr:HAD family phosphatase [Candidatus Micrarchaeota archaeon]
MSRSSGPNMTRLHFNPWHWMLTAAFFFLLAGTFGSSGLVGMGGGPEELAGTLLISYLLAQVTFIPVKRFFFTKAVLFDMGGVVTQGDFYTEVLTEMPGTRDLIERLKVNYKVAMLTNNNALGFEPFNRKFGFSRLFDDVIVSGKEGVKKPDAKIFQIALRRLHVKASNAYFLDDTAANVDAAKALGIHGIVFTDAKSAEVCLKKAGLTF